MKKTKLLISRALCICICMSLLLVPSISHAAGEVISAQQLGLLTALGIIDDVSEEDLNLQVSRAEFAVNIVRFANLGSSITANRKFKDVMHGVYEENYISMAVEAGLMAPVNSEYFYPGYPVTYAEAAQALVMSLGYKNLAQINNSYLQLAREIDILDGVSAEGVFTRSKLYKMLFNALHAQTLNISGIAGDDVTYTQDAERDALKVFYNIKHDEGIITAAGGIELGAGINDTYKKCIKHNGNVYYMETTGVKEALGRNAVVYYNADNEVIYVLYKRNTEVKLSAKDINSYAGFAYYYGQNNKKLTLHNPYVIYNGEEYTDAYTQTIMQPASGSVVLIDNNRDNKYDVVIIESYKDYKVKGRIDDPATILTEYGEPVDIDSSKYDVTVYNTKGEIDEFESIGKDMIISVAAGSERMTVYTCDETVTGVLSVAWQSGGMREWQIGEKIYNPSATLEARIDGGSVSEPEIGTNYKWYLNVDGEIAFFQKVTSTDGNEPYYAILTGAGTEGVIDVSVKVRVFAKELGGFQTLECADKLTLNGERKDKSAVIGALKKNGINGEETNAVVAQPVKILVNADGKVSFIAQAGAKADTSSEFQFFMGSLTDKTRAIPYRSILEIFSSNWSIADNPYWTANMSGAGCLQIGMRDDMTVCYQVPYKADGTIDGSLEEAFLSKRLPSATTLYSYVYTEDEDSLVASLVIEAVDAEVKENCGVDFEIRVVTEITQEMLDDEVVTGVQTNEGKYYLKNPNIDLDNLVLYDANGNARVDENGEELTYGIKPGDLINVTVDVTGFISGIEAIYDAQNGVMLTQNGTSASARKGEGWMLMKTELLETKNGFMRATTGSASNFIEGTDMYVFTQIPQKNVVVEKNKDMISTYTGSTADYVGYNDSPEEYVICIVGSKFMQVQGTKMSTFLYRYKDWN